MLNAIEITNKNIRAGSRSEQVRFQCVSGIVSKRQHSRLLASEETRFRGQEIRALYDSAAYPLKRRATAG
jgi:hypothetical protein